MLLQLPPFLIHRFAVPLPPGGRYCAADIPTNSNLLGCWEKPIGKFLIIPGGDTTSYI